MIHIKEVVDLTKYKLIIPCVAVGNVGQLAVDLLISSLSMRKIGSVIEKSFIPVVGPDPNNENSNENCSTVDIYIHEDAKIIVFQIRSLLTRKPISFFHKLANFVKDNKIDKVIILTSSYAEEKRDGQIRSTSLRYISSQQLFLEYQEFFKTNSWLTFEKKIMDFVNDEKLQIPGGGYAIDLFNIFQSENVQCIILIKLCSEGDNIPDALSLLKYFNRFLTVIPEESETLKIIYPSSWKYLFGNSPPMEIY